MRFSYRQYQDGDAAAINALYFAVTGRIRTIEQHAWQWLQSPAGESEMWLIEAELDDGSNRLIGHHGVMAEAFTFRGTQVRVGKTENTMVLPAYRDKLLYPRYEKKFLNHYEERFHALFSTTGPAPAIRLRQAMGYEAHQRWICFYVGREPFLSIDLIQERYARSVAALPAKMDAIGVTKFGAASVACLNVQYPGFDFDAFWARVSPNYGLTPARTRANLNWRFWSNPYVVHHTLKLDDPTHGTAIGIVSMRAGHVLHVDDLYCERPAQLGHFMTLLSRWAVAHVGLKTIVSETTTDSFRFFGACKPRTTTWVHRLAGRRLENRYMPRKVTPLGCAAGINPADDWYVTPFYFEGR